MSSASYARGIPYTRLQIQEIVGGENQTYLPQRNKIILAGCFVREAMNPHAPEQVLVGNSRKVVLKAELLRDQPDTQFPVFLKEKKLDKVYFFRGIYQFDHLSSDRRALDAAEERSGRLGQLAYILHLKPA